MIHIAGLYNMKYEVRIAAWSWDIDPIGSKADIQMLGSSRAEGE
jgi:hypothetical protein